MTQKRFRVLILVCTCSVVGLVMLAIVASRINAERSLDFPIFAPTQLPQGVAVTSHEVSIYQGEGSTFKRLVYSTNSPNFVIWEVKSSPDDYSLRTFSCKMAPDFSDCNIYTTPDRQPFAIQTTYIHSSPDKPFEQVISWLRGITLIWIDLKADQIQKDSPNVWAKVIDGFAPANYEHDPVKYYKWQGV